MRANGMLDGITPAVASILRSEAQTAKEHLESQVSLAYAMHGPASVEEGEGGTAVMIQPMLQLVEEQTPTEYQVSVEPALGQELALAQLEYGSSGSPKVPVFSMEARLMQNRETAVVQQIETLVNTAVKAALNA